MLLVYMRVGALKSYIFLAQNVVPFRAGTRGGRNIRNRERYTKLESSRHVVMYTDSRKLARSEMYTLRMMRVGRAIPQDVNCRVDRIRTLPVLKFLTEIGLVKKAINVVMQQIMPL